MMAVKYFSELKGKTIADVVNLGKADIEDAYWHCVPEETVLIRFTDGTGAIILADAEGNGPGWLEVVELVAG